MAGMSTGLSLKEHVHPELVASAEQVCLSTNQYEIQTLPMVR